MYWYNASEWIKGIPVTRYISSYYIAGGKPYYNMVKMWLEQLVINDQVLSEEEVALLADCIVNGKMELEMNAKKFIAKNKNNDDI